MSTIQNRGRQGAGAASPIRNLAQFVFFGTFIAGMIFALPTMLVLTLGLLPTIVAFIVDMHPRKYAARSVGFLNFAGTLPFLVTLWSKNHSLIEAMRILTDVYAWLVIYAAAAVGWIIYLGMPSVAGFLMELTAAHRARKLDAERKRLIQEWGEGVNRSGSLPG